MPGPTVVKVLVPPHLEPLEDGIRRMVVLSDGSERVEQWDFVQCAWLTLPDGACVYAVGLFLGDAARGKFAIPPDAGGS